MVLKKSKRLQKMAMNANQDQNFNVHSDGVKTRSSTIQKNRGGGLEGKKAPNGISKPPAINTSRKQNPKNVIRIGEDVGVLKKAPVDLTDSVKPIQSPQKKRSRKKKSIPPIAETSHNHNKSIPPIEYDDAFYDHDEFIKAHQIAQQIALQIAQDSDEGEEDFWRRREDLSRYPKLKEYFEKKAITEAKVDHGSRNPSGMPVILANFDGVFCFHATRSP